MSYAEIVLPETKPETEWIDGRAVQKMSPTFSHGRVQTVFAAELLAWSRGRGQVATEWRFRIEPPGEERRPLVPDIAYVANDRLAGVSADDREVPAFAPTVAVEVLSRGDFASNVASKTSVYLRSGTSLVIILDPKSRTAKMHDASGTTELRGDAELAHDALPGFAVRLDRFYALALDDAAL